MANRTRRNRRAEHHAASHAEAAPPQAVPEHPDIPGGEPVMVTSSEQLDVVAETIRTEGAFAYDTEFIGESTYIPELCLIQASTRSTLWLIDPFQLESLDPVWSLIADPEVTTIVHAGAQDLEPVERHIGRVPAKVVDTQVAAGFMGLPYPVSLARLVFEMTGWTVPKGMTFTDWSKRPLSSMQLRYAADDVRYLPLIWDRMQEQLNSFGHLDLAFEECASACKPGAFLPDIAKQCRKIHRKNPMRSGQWSRLHHLMSLRDECAREANLPPRTLIPDGCISDLARRNPTTIEALRQLKGMPRPTVERHGKSILQRLAREDDEHIPDRPEKLPDETAVIRVQIDAIWSAISCWCLSNSIAPALVGTRNCIAEWIGTGGLDDHGHGPWSYGWRREIAGDFLLRFLRSECTLPMQWEDGRLVQQDDPN